jgi:hypothetical protein
LFAWRSAALGFLESVTATSLWWFG